MKLSFPASPGVALVVVLWAVSLISAAMLGLAAILQGQLGQEIAALQNARAMLAAESGIQMVLNSQLLRADMEQACQQLNTQLASGWKVPARFEVKTEDFRGEDGKLNMNALLLNPDKAQARRVLQNLFAGWEVNLSTSSRLIDTLLDWVDVDSLTQASGAETEDYVKLNLSGPRNAPFENIEELQRVLGWREMAKEAQEGSKAVRALSKFTIFGSGKLSLFSADQDLIEAVLGMAPNGAANFIQARLGPDGQAGTQDDQVNVALLPGVSPEILAAYTTNGGEDLWRVTSTGFVGEAKRKVVALISRNPPQIKARWTEDTEP
ncbi:MAG: type II secretion system protein GspK [Verrucomicrobia bacterium]|nr:type II secretion system protein GspK [Verrucomicrobiota bacterium]